jgi:hypothetical protein
MHIGKIEEAEFNNQGQIIKAERIKNVNIQICETII